VAVDDGRFPRSQQIGATGRTVQARGYLAMGISGAVQHLQGIRECRHVIAVNTDPAAPIAQRSELTVAEDVQNLMRALLTLVRATPNPLETAR
jgi:electron transfer flavoprotein alpha subunit